MPLESTNTNSTPMSYLGFKTKITATLFADEPEPPVNTELLSCTYSDCRDYKGGNDCYINPVFADPYSDSELTNDKSSFLFFYPFTTTSEFTNSSLSRFYIEKNVSGTWGTTTLLTGSTYGTYYDFQSLSQDGYKGFIIHWKNVYNLLGEGVYRFKAISEIYGTTSCVVSPPYCLKIYSCHGTNGTVKFEANITGKIGKKSGSTESQVVDLASQSQLTDLTGIDWYMSIRVPGFFGNEKTEYETINIEYENGQINNVRDEAIQKYEFNSGRLPKYVHDQLKVYMFMANRLRVTDFNHNNSDYFVNQKEVVREGGYEPEYNIHSRLSKVKVVFKDRIQNLIKVIC
jgi:hypothetical protein